MSKEVPEIVKLYRYIRFCLFAVGATDFQSMATMRDMQHDIFLYLVERKGIKEFNAGSRRFAYQLSKYYPNFLGYNKYTRTAEQVLVDSYGETIEPGVSNEMTGDVAYDLELYESFKEAVKVAGNVTARPVLVTYITGDERQFPSVAAVMADIGCSEFTAWNWLKNGKKSRANKEKDKYGHIMSLSYMSLINPFAGNKVVVKRVIGESQWDSKTDQGDYELDDYNEYYTLYVHKESGEGLLVRLKESKQFYPKPDA